MITSSAPIPEVDASLIPLVAEDGNDWRSVADELREKYPFLRIRGDDTIWFTRYEAAREMYLDWELFAQIRADVTGRYLVPGSEDPPRSTDFRRALLPLYGPAQVAYWETRMRDAARALVDQFVEDGEVDLIDKFTRRFFPYIGAEMLGVPAEDHWLLSEWENQLFSVDPSLLVTDLPHLKPMKKPIEDDLVAYLEGVIKEKRRNPGDDLVSLLLKIKVKGEPLSAIAVRGAVEHFVFGAAHTVGSHLGYVFKHLAEVPELRKAVVAGTSSIDRIGEEILRIYPIWGFSRTVTRNTVFHGCSLKAGDRVFALLTMPNRDPRSQDFGELNYDRHPNRHLGFMVGVHQCLGMHWARSARRIAVEEWHRRIPEYRIKPGVQLVEQVYLGVGWLSLPLEWDVPAQSAAA